MVKRIFTKFVSINIINSTNYDMAFTRESDDDDDDDDVCVCARASVYESALLCEVV